MTWWIDKFGRLYQGDCISGDREATEAEVDSKERKTIFVVTMRQARLALLHEGLLQSADQAIAAMSGVEGETARIEWGYAGTVERSSPLVGAIGQLLGLDDAALDDLFALAARL